ncbi:hypothetical protein DPMN_113198 [Dreissena polymorpha]|uniref:Uncharacterized protein n=1 Tax=Dreissena polymorpha TaxID=45954 RepID=A0A9D4QQH0_DREPO|nr:hypothetical protein DPMN_113198 [Dreissena polymorpha]
MHINNYRTGFTYPTEIQQYLSEPFQSTSNFSHHIGFPGVIPVTRPGRFTRTRNAGYTTLNTLQDCVPGHARRRPPSSTSLEKLEQKMSEMRYS